MTSVRAFVGQPAADIETPALVIDLDAMERNLTRMAEFAKAHRVRLRPHAKTHKCAELARLQIAAGAVGVCVQKVDEAEALAAAGIGDIYVSNEVIDPIKLQRVATLAGRIRLAIAVDSALGVERLAAALAHAGTRATCSSRSTSGMAAAESRRSQPVRWRIRSSRTGCAFAGLQAYHGRAQHLRGAAEREAVIRHAVGLARAAQASVSAAGLECRLVTGAGTGTFVHEAASGLYGEIQPGSYLFLDRDYADNEPSAAAPRFEHALFVEGAGDEPRRLARRRRRRPQIACDRLGAAEGLDSATSIPNGGDEHGILRPGRCCGGAAGTRRGRLARSPGIATRRSISMTTTSVCAVASRSGLSRRSGRSKRAAACVDCGAALGRAQGRPRRGQSLERGFPRPRRFARGGQARP